MIDETTIRAALEGVLGTDCAGIPVFRADDPRDTCAGPHVVTLMAISQQPDKVSNALTICAGMFQAAVHVPFGDGVIACEELGRQVRDRFFPLDQYLSGMVRVEGIGMLPARRGSDALRGESGTQFMVCHVQIDWDIHQIGG